jgi:hypothetical protein
MKVIDLIDLLQQENPEDEIIVLGICFARSGAGKRKN